MKDMSNASAAVRKACGEQTYKDPRGTKAALTKLRRKLEAKEIELSEVQLKASQLETEIGSLKRRVTQMEKSLGVKPKRTRKSNGRKAA